jgi:hypothetical protein
MPKTGSTVCRFDRPGAKTARRVTIDQQRQHHPGRVLLAAAPPLVDPKIGDGQLLHGIQDKMHDMAGGHPFDSAQGPDPSTPLRVQTTPADHTAETSASGGPSLQNGQAYTFDAFPRRKFRSIKNFLRMFRLQDQTASAVCLAAWRAKPDRLLARRDTLPAGRRESVLRTSRPTICLSLDPSSPDSTSPLS